MYHSHIREDGDIANQERGLRIFETCMIPFYLKPYTATREPLSCSVATVGQQLRRKLTQKIIIVSQDIMMGITTSFD